jgi:DMSO/TMAO reductase YedYZ molybdopterin-dependent catalytic subunit
MPDTTFLKIDGEVDRPAQFSRAELATVKSQFQITDVSQFDPKRRGRAVRLAGLLDQVGARASAAWLTLHSTADDFHASVPLAAVRERAVLIYELEDAALPAAAGGPFRFLIPDFAACHTADVDECANVKFVDRIELSRERGHDNRPADERQHAALHQREAEHKDP